MKASKRQLENRISILVPLNVLEKLSLSSQLNFNVAHNLIWYFFRKQFPEARGKGDENMLKHSQKRQTNGEESPIIATPFRKVSTDKKKSTM